MLYAVAVAVTIIRAHTHHVRNCMKLYAIPLVYILQPKSAQIMRLGLGAAALSGDERAENVVQRDAISGQPLRMVAQVVGGDCCAAVITSGSAQAC